MKRIAPLLLLLVLATACKESGWTWVQRAGGEVDSGSPLPPDDAQDGRDIIFVLGIDGMD